MWPFFPHLKHFLSLLGFPSFFGSPFCFGQLFGLFPFPRFSFALSISIGPGPRYVLPAVDLSCFCVFFSPEKSGAHLPFRSAYRSSSRADICRTWSTNSCSVSDRVVCTRASLM